MRTDDVVLGWISGSLFATLVALAVAHPGIWLSLGLLFIWLLAAIAACAVTSSGSQTLKRPSEAPPRPAVRDITAR